MMVDTVRVSQREQLQAVADRMATAGVPAAPLYAAVAAGQIALVQISNLQVKWPAAAIAAPRKPVVVLLAGDPGWGEPTYGPTRWKCSERLRRWAYGALVHGAEGKPVHYRAAIEMAIALGRFALIETSSDLVTPWRNFLAPMPTICLVPHDGGVHPVAPAVLQ